MIRNFVTNSEDVDLTRKRLSYEIICHSALHFFNAYLKDNNESLAYLKNEPSTDNSSLNLVSVTFKESLPLPPTEEKFLELIREGAFDQAHNVYKEVKTRDPKYILFKEQNLINLAFILFDDLNRRIDAIKIMKLNIEEYPESYKSYGYLARLYEKNQEWKNALNYFSMAQSMALKEKNRPEKNLAWYKRKIEKLMKKL